MAQLDLLGSRRERLVASAIALGALDLGPLSDAERVLIPPAGSLCSAAPIAYLREMILSGADPLGGAFSALFSNDERRPMGATYTPQPIVDAMVRWARDNSSPARIVDPGAGSARFLVSAGRAFPNADLVAIEIDPLASLLSRANLVTAGMGQRAKVIVHDFRTAQLLPIAGQTLFIGNPPYVRHHLIPTEAKMWLTRVAKEQGLDASQLAGLHVYFFLATLKHAQNGDVGTFITASEWLDVNYGRLVRQLLLGKLGAKNIQVVEPTAEPFPGTQTTATITGFQVGAKPETVGLRRIASTDNLGRLETDWFVRRERLEASDRWSPLTRSNPAVREGLIELGELCRVHRGQVTGANRVWVSSSNEHELPESVMFSAVTRARELFATDGILIDLATLRRVIDIPVDLDVFDAKELKTIRRFLQFAKIQGADRGFVASHRKSWWSVGLRKPAPILATYMARRPPMFVRNIADARHINIAHGLYPREILSETQLLNLANYLSGSVSLTEGRSYAGGLTKFEPREMERLLIPGPELLSLPTSAKVVR